MSVSKVYISPDQLRLDSIKLGLQVVQNGFKPTFMVALWRGGCPVGCIVHELLKWKGLTVDHIAIRTSRYTGIDKVGDGEVVVHSTSYLVETLKPNDSILLVDDVWDSGTTIVAFIKKLKESLTFPVDIRFATLYYKPSRNKTVLVPHYYVHESNDWLVFPHELEGMDLAEVELAMGKEIASLLKE